MVRPLTDRFWEKVAIGPDCWEWTHRRSQKGYGVLYVGGSGSRMAHRVSWELQHGPVPRGMYVLHHCDNPPCVRPSHLFLGTIADNARDASRKGRTASGEANGRSKLTAVDVADIRARVAAGGWGTTASLTREYHISRTTVRSIVRGDIWKGVA